MSTLSIPLLSLRPLAELSAAGVGSACFFFLFWTQDPGLNFLVWTGIVLSLCLILHAEARRRVQVWITAAGALFSAACLALSGNPLATWSCIISLMACSGFVLESRLRSLLAPGLLVLVNAFRVPLSAIEKIFALLPARASRSFTFQAIHLAIVPAIFLFIFFLLFVTANPHFAEWVESLANRFEAGFEWMRPEKIIFLGIGFVITAALLWRGVGEWPVAFDLKGTSAISRVRRPTQWVKNLNSTLRMEFRSGLMLLVGINLLLLVVNASDLNWVWLGQMDASEEQAHQLSHLVHEGTNILIFSILLSMAIMLWLFRDKMNFFSRNKWLKAGCYVWIAQNGFLVGTVALSNWRYISTYGLTYQRVGVYFFLALALAGLCMLWFKIRGGKTFFWLLTRNSWAFYACILLLGMVNWNYQITRFNLSLNNGNPPDVEYLLSLAPESLPLMQEQRSKLFPGDIAYRLYVDRQTFDDHIYSFLRRWEEQGWQSWNYSGEQVYAYFSSRRDQWIQYRR